MNKKFIKATEQEQIELLSSKANEIWHEYFPGIISKEQIDYMVDMFLSPKSIKQEIAEGYEFYLYYLDDEVIGFVVVRPEADILFISKLYLDKEHRGNGFATDMFDLIKSVAARENLQKMYLTVNKHNENSINVYKHKGFTIINDVVTDIGDGYVMDDYVMECDVSKKELAMQNFKAGYNCSQAIVKAFSKEMGIDETILLKMASSFGGGMGRLREVCGAVSGIFMVAGVLRGYEDPTANDEKTKHYELIQKLAKEFSNINGSIVCKELLGVGGSQPPTPEKRTEQYYSKRPCVQLVGDAAEILEKILL